MSETSSPSRHNFGKPVSSSWFEVQLRAFTFWVNAVLEPISMEVDDLETGFESGVKLVRFLEILAAPKKVKQRLDMNPKMRIQKIQNLSIAIQFLKEEMNCSKVSISAEDFVDKNLKLILGMLWTLFREYKIETIKEEDKSSEEGLLLWVRKQCESYKSVKISNYANSFRDGRAFLALVHRYNESVVEFEELDEGNGKAADMYRLETAFKAAETYLGVPQLLSEKDVNKGEVDERGMVLYVSLFFHAFVAREEREKIISSSQSELSAEKAELAKARQELEQLEKERAHMSETLSKKATSIQELDEQNSELRKMLDEMNAKSDKMAAELKKYRKQASQLNEAKSALTEKDSYLEEKVEVLKELLQTETEEKSDLEELVTELQLKLKHSESDREAAVDAAKTIKKEVEELRSKKESTDAAEEALKLLIKTLAVHLRDLSQWKSLVNSDSAAAALEDGKQEKEDDETKSHTERLARFDTLLGDRSKSISALLESLAGTKKAARESAAAENEDDGAMKKSKSKREKSNSRKSKS